MLPDSHLCELRVQIADRLSHGTPFERVLRDADDAENLSISRCTNLAQALQMSSKALLDSCQGLLSCRRRGCGGCYLAQHHVGEQRVVGRLLASQVRDIAQG